MKKCISLALAILLLLSLAACGSSEPLGCEGTYISVATTALGMTLTGEDAAGVTLTLEVGGKGTCDIEGSAGKLKWKLDGDQMTITIDGTDIVGTYSKDMIKVADFMGMGLDCVFAIEGSEAAKPGNFMSDAEKQLVKDWFPYRVTNVLGDPIPEDEMAPWDFGLALNDDYTAMVFFQGEELIGGGKWSLYEDFGSFDNDWDCGGVPATITFEPIENSAHLEVTFSCGDMYYLFLCAEQEEADRIMEEEAAADSGSEAGSVFRFAAVSCMMDGDEYECEGDYIELYDIENGSDQGVVCFNGGLYEMEFTWYDDNTFTFTDESGDTFEGVFRDNALIGTYCGYDYIFELVAG